MTNGLSHAYPLDVSTFILGVLGVIFIFISIFDKFPMSKQNSPRSDIAFTASILGLFCLPMSEKRTLGLYELSREIKDCTCSISKYLCDRASIYPIRPLIARYIK